MCVLKSKDKMTTDRFHKAARDGLIEVLKEATRKDMNARDNEKMTPVMWAAFEGRLDALRLLCGRGGDPDKCDQFGNAALHLAAAKGHLSCVDFLTKFGVNIYSLDIDKHSAKDLAAINSKDEILRYLDAAAAKFEAHDKRKAKALKEVAEKNCEKRIREYIKQQRREEHENSDIRPGTSGKSSKVLSSLKQKIWSSQGNLNKSCNDISAQQCSAKSCNKFSDLVTSGGSSGDSTIASRTNTMQKMPQCSNSSTGYVTGSNNSAFKIGEVEADGKRTVTSLTGLQRDSEVLYVGTFSSTEDGGKRGKISDVFELEESSINSVQDANKLGYGALARSFSQPDILGDSQVTDDFNENLMLSRPNRLFERPTMLGSIAFRRSVTAALSQLQPNTEHLGSDDIYNSTGKTLHNISGNRSKTRSGSKLRLCLNLSDDSDSDGRDEEVYSEEDDESKIGTPLQRFLAVWSLEEYLQVFQQQEIDLSTLMLLTESDLKSLGLPLGPFRKLTFAIQERRNALENPGPMIDSRL